MLHASQPKTMTERQKRIFDFISTNRAGVLASVDPNGEPHATVIYHAISNKDFSVSFLTKQGTKKYDNLMHNNHVVLVVFDAFTQTVAQVIGEAQAIENPDAFNDVAAAVATTGLETSPNGVLPVTKLNAGDYAAIKIVPKQIRMACYARPDSGDNSQLFESLESFELEVN